MTAFTQVPSLTRGSWTSCWDFGPQKLPWQPILSEHSCKSVLTSEIKMSCGFSGSMTLPNLNLKSRSWSLHAWCLEYRRVPSYWIELSGTTWKSTCQHTLSWWSESLSQFMLTMLWAEPKPKGKPSWCTESPRPCCARGALISTSSTELIHREENAGCPSPAATHHSDETYSKTVLGGAQSIPAGEQKMLGVRWCVETDHLVLDVSEVGRQARSLPPTKRNIVSIVGRIYDPLGFLSPVLIRLKSLFQELCELKLEWDEPHTGAPLSKWESMVADLQADQ